MDLMVNVTTIHNKMKDKPKGQKLYHFFYGAAGALTKAQVKEVRKIVAEENQRTIKFLDAIEKQMDGVA